MFGEQEKPVSLEITPNRNEAIVKEYSELLQEWGRWERCSMSLEIMWRKFPEDQQDAAKHVFEVAYSQKAVAHEKYEEFLKSRGLVDIHAEGIKDSAGNVIVSVDEIRKIQEAGRKEDRDYFYK